MENYNNKQIEDLPNEKWKPVVGLEEFYHVSNLGRVKSIQGKSRKNDKILTQSPNVKDGTGYLQVSFRRGLDKMYRVCVHRLVAEAFIYNDDPLNKRIVNHKDENRLDNESNNLEWCTQKYNIGYSFERHRKDRIAKLRTSCSNIQPTSKCFAPFWHNGDAIKRSFECPGEEWERGWSPSLREQHASRLRKYNQQHPENQFKIGNVHGRNCRSE